MSTENNIKILQDIVLQYDKATISGTKPANIIQNSLNEVTINDIPGFEQRCSIIAWHLAYIEYSRQNPEKSIKSFAVEGISTIEGLRIYQEAFEKAQNALEPNLTIAKLKSFVEAS